jgi:Na+/proline symporter
MKDASLLAWVALGVYAFFFILNLWAIIYDKLKDKDSKDIPKMRKSAFITVPLLGPVFWVLVIMVILSRASRDYNSTSGWPEKIFMWFLEKPKPSKA